MTMDVNVFLVDLPIGVNESVVPNEDGTYTIFLNARLSIESQALGYDHAIKHIEENDFQKDDADMIEMQAHANNSFSLVEPAPVKKYEKLIERLQRERRKIKRQMAQNEKRVQFLEEIGYDFFAAAENEWLYGGL